MSLEIAPAAFGGPEPDPIDWNDATADIPPQRRVKLTRASAIKIRPVHWLWQDRVALGTFALLGGREGIGKSTVAYQIVADITRGRLKGTHHRKPSAVIIAATEDSWAHTIAPRLIAAGADLDLVYRVEAITIGDTVIDTAPTFPRDLEALEQAIRDVDAALVLLDPLMSRLSSKLNTHQDHEARQALEPLAKVADDTKCSILGLIHVNKSSSNDPLTLIMASRAFVAVARAALFVVKDPENPELRYLGEPKNNLGRDDLPLLSFSIESAHVADTDEGAVWSSKVRWQGEVDRTVQDVIEAAMEGTDVRTAVGEAADWLEGYLASHGGIDDSDTIRSAAMKAHHSVSSLQRARLRMKLTVSSSGYPRRTFWSLPNTQVTTEITDTTETNGTTDTTETTDTSGQTGMEYPSVVSVVSVESDFTSTRGRAPARERDANTCPRCEWPLDHPDHFAICGGDE